MTWLILAALCLPALALLGYPLLSRRSQTVGRDEGGLAVYRQQLKELDADITRGVLSEQDAEPTRIEIQRRILRLGKSGSEDGNLTSGRMPLLTLGLVLVVTLSSFGLYSYLGSPGLASKPLASRNIALEKRDLAGRDLGNLVKRLAEKLQENPENLDGWILLARTLSRMERYEQAAETFLQATKLAPKDADLFVGAGENYYFKSDGMVSQKAVEAFEAAYALDPTHAGARYYLALHAAQNGRRQEALNSWMTLFEESDASAPYMRILRGRIAELAGEINVDVSALLSSKGEERSTQAGPSQDDMQAAADMSKEDREQMIQEMVGRLAERMQAEPDFEGLMRLGQVYGTLGQFDKSAEAYGRAAEIDGGNPAPLAGQAFALIRHAEEGSPPPEEAVALYRRVLELDETAPEALWYVGIAEARAGNRETALQYWTRLKSLVPEGSQVSANVTRAINALSETPQN